MAYEIISTVDSIILHPKYKWNTWDYNLSLIKLREKIELVDHRLQAVSWPPFLYGNVNTAITYYVSTIKEQ